MPAKDCSSVLDDRLFNLHDCPGGILVTMRTNGKLQDELIIKTNHILLPKATRFLVDWQLYQNKHKVLAFCIHGRVFTLAPALFSLRT